MAYLWNTNRTHHLGKAKSNGSRLDVSMDGKSIGYVDKKTGKIYKTGVGFVGSEKDGVVKNAAGHEVGKLDGRAIMKHNKVVAKVDPGSTHKSQDAAAYLLLLHSKNETQLKKPELKDFPKKDIPSFGSRLGGLLTGFRNQPSGSSRSKDGDSDGEGMRK